MPIRMKDIAKDLGVSVVTISKVLRNHPDIGEETRSRVLKHVKDLDYQPNALARSLVTGRSFLVGLVVPDLIHSFFAEVAQAISHTIQAHGYSLILSSSEENPELESQEIRQLVARRLDALVIASTAASGEQFDRLKQHRQPYLLIDRSFPGRSENFVGIDDVAVGRIATTHLIDAGCRRVAHIGSSENSTGIDRHEGYRQALQQHGMTYSPEHVIRRTNIDTASMQHGAEVARILLGHKNRPDGIFCYSDSLAVGAMDAILDAGMRIPEDIAIIGCGNLHYLNSLRVPLSSIDQCTQLIGQRAGEIVLKLISAKEPLTPQRVILEPRLIIRASTQRKKGKTPVVAGKKMAGKKPSL
jgi:LacI family transcriptional regulator